VLHTVGLAGISIPVQNFLAVGKGHLSRFNLSLPFFLAVLCETAAGLDRL